MHPIVLNRSAARGVLVNLTGLAPRLVLRKGDLYRLPASRCGLEVVSGVAWVTVKDQDVVLASGERLLLSAHRDAVLISAVGHTPLIVEFFEANP